MDAINLINNELGCPYTELNGYTMEAWDYVYHSNIDSLWGFFSPEQKLIDLLEPGYIENAGKPENWDDTVILPLFL